MNYPSIRIEGAILSPDILDRLEDLQGQRPADFGIASPAKVKDEIARAWADAQDYWRIYQRKIESLGPNSLGTTETRNLWIVPLLGLLGYQLEYQHHGIKIGDKNYPISHRTLNRALAAVHITGYRDPAGLDRKPERTSGPRMSAHAMVQEYLNLSDQLYAVVTNGKLLRLLRDSSRLVKLTYLEFDLDRIFTDGLFADFAVLYRLLHATRMPVSPDTAAESLIERYHQDSIEQGTRIRDGLRDAVVDAITLLGSSLVSDPHNQLLRDQLDAKVLLPQQFFAQLLRLVYRVLFLNVIEERHLVFAPSTPRKLREIYEFSYSLNRLRRISRLRGIHTHRQHDGWLGLLSTFALFGNPDLASRLGLTALGGQLFHPNAIGVLGSCRIDNRSFYRALDRLCSFQDPATGNRVPVNFGALATEELGSIYESLLELHPIITPNGPEHFSFAQFAGNERKTTGSYYTPASLVDCLLDSALNPVLDDRIARFETLGYPDAQTAILEITVCDPACGSGHFLIAAAQRIARRLALVRSGDSEPAPDQYRHALRQVISHCIYGVDINPMAVELCRIALWLESVEPGKPLSFLDHRIQVGNSLLGTTPALLSRGIPDEAFEPIEGDDKARCKVFKKQNKDERKGQGMLFGHESAPWLNLGNLAASVISKLDSLPDDSLGDIRTREQQYAELIHSSTYESGQLLADAWCAAFVFPKTKAFDYPITEKLFRDIERNPHSIPPWMKDEIRRLARQYQFFHWHFAFPDVFTQKPSHHDDDVIGWTGGFDVVLGNPPWERIKLQEKEWFAERMPSIANAPNAAARRRMIDALAASNPNLHAAFLEDRRKAEGESALARESGRFPLCGRGDVNTYTLFAESMRQITAGRVGVIVPSGIATDDTTKYFFRDLIDTASLVSLYDFENRLGIFPAVDSRYKFCLLTLRDTGAPAQAKLPARFAFFLHSVDELSDPDRTFTLSAADIALLNPNTRTCPVFRSKQDAELTKHIYRRVPVLIREAHGDQPEVNPWGVKFLRMFDMSNDSGLFRTREQLETEGWRLRGSIFERDGQRFLPLYEAKLFHQFDHRFASYADIRDCRSSDATTRDMTGTEKADPDVLVLPRYWVPAEEVAARLGRDDGTYLMTDTDVAEREREREREQTACHSESPTDYIPTTRRTRGWLLAFRRITNVTNERTGIFAMIPSWAAGDSTFLMLPLSAGSWQ